MNDERNGAKVKKKYFLGDVLDNSLSIDNIFEN